MREALTPATIARSVAVLLAAWLLAAAPVAAQDAPKPSAASPSTLVVAGTDGAGLLLRAGPGREHPVLAVLPEGASVSILEQPVSDGHMAWYHVRIAGSGTLSGYSSADYLRPAPAAVVQAVSTAAPAPAPSAEGRVISALVTGYAAGADGGAVGGMTASGKPTRWGTVAADLSRYPFGTRLLIEGFGDTVFVVEDTGSGVRDDVFDVWFPDLPAAQAFGTQRRQVTILGQQ